MHYGSKQNRCDVKLWFINFGFDKWVGKSWCHGLCWHGATVELIIHDKPKLVAVWMAVGHCSHLTCSNYQHWVALLPVVMMSLATLVQRLDIAHGPQWTAAHILISHDQWHHHHPSTQIWSTIAHHTLTHTALSNNIWSTIAHHILTHTALSNNISYQFVTKIYIR